MPNNANNHHDQTPASAIRAYLGGSFDPVHNGHLQMAMSVYEHLSSITQQQQRPLQVSLLPNARSPFKRQSTNPAHRLAMLKLATQETPLQISELELWQAPPVYTIDSVKALRRRYPNDSLIFIMGMDSARQLDKWQDGLQLTHYVHLWIFNRLDAHQSDSLGATTPLYQLPTELQGQVTASLADLTTVLKNDDQGRIYIDQRQVSTVSSTDIRNQLQTQSNPPDTLPKPLAQLINPAVYHYIIAHRLYSAAQFR